MSTIQSVPGNLLRAVIPDVSEGLSARNAAKAAICIYTATQVAVVAIALIKYAAVLGMLYLAYNACQKNRAIKDLSDQPLENPEKANSNMDALRNTLERLGVIIPVERLQKGIGTLYSNLKAARAENIQLTELLREAQNELCTLQGTANSLGARWLPNHRA